MRLGVWVPFRAQGALGPPEDLPLGRAALALQEHDVDLVLGAPDARGRFDGVVARPGAWLPIEGAPVAAVYDRFPSASRPEAFAAGLRALGELPVGNPPEITELCRDKLRCQQVLEAAGVPQPPVVGDLDAQPGALVAWGAAFLKPRHGSFGRGVRRVVPGDPLPTDGEWVLQRAVVPPVAHGAGLALRVLVQRDVRGGVVVRSPVARRSADDPVVNAARGAEVLPAADLDLPLDAIRSLAVRTFEALAARAEPALEVGVDVVLDPANTPLVIEVNSRPRGRLRALAEAWPDRFVEEHTHACALPFLRLAEVVRRG